MNPHTLPCGLDKKQGFDPWALESLRLATASSNGVILVKSPPLLRKSRRSGGVPSRRFLLEKIPYSGFDSRLPHSRSFRHGVVSFYGLSESAPHNLDAASHGRLRRGAKRLLALAVSTSADCAGQKGMRQSPFKSTRRQPGKSESSLPGVQKKISRRNVWLM